MVNIMSARNISSHKAGTDEPPPQEYTKNYIRRTNLYERWRYIHLYGGRISLSKKKKNLNSERWS